MRIAAHSHSYHSQDSHRIISTDTLHVRDSLQKTLRCNCNIFNFCNFCNISRDWQLQYLQHFWQTAAYMQGDLAQNTLLQLSQLPQFPQQNPPGMDDISHSPAISFSETDDNSQDSRILILIISFITRHLEHSVSLRAKGCQLEANHKL